MKILCGRLKGKSLIVPKNSPIRPTSAKLRETIFHILKTLPELEKSFEETVMLDLCAGTGSVGFEALSLGFKHVSFVELDSKHMAVCKKNAHILNVEDQSHIYKANILHPYTVDRKHDLVFFDPPYGFKQHQKVVSQFVEKGWLEEQSVWLIEHSKHDQIQIDLPYASFIQERRYGDTVLSLFLVTSIPE